EAHCLQETEYHLSPRQFPRAECGLALLPASESELHVVAIVMRGKVFVTFNCKDTLKSSFDRQFCSGQPTFQNSGIESRDSKISYICRPLLLKVNSGVSYAFVLRS